jgi:hypothetical protein
MARQKKTEPQELIDIETLPDLTDPERTFVDRLLVGDRACDAYKAAYPQYAHWEPKSINTSASRLRNKDTIKAWLHAARQAGLANSACTVEQHLAELQRLVYAAEASGNYGAAVQAEKLRGEVAGLYVSRYEDVGKGVSEKELLTKLKGLLGDQATLVLDRLGIKEKDEGKAH